MPLSLQTAEKYFNWANIGLAISLASGLFATVVIIWAGNVKENHLKRELAEANAKAANAILESERIKMEVSWRSLNDNTGINLVNRLSASPSKVVVAFAMDDPEAAELARQLQWVFQKAKWEVAISSRKYISTVMKGIIVSPNTWPKSIEVNTYINDAGLISSLYTLPIPEMILGELIPDSDGHITVYVGHKPPAFKTVR